MSLFAACFWLGLALAATAVGQLIFKRATVQRSRVLMAIAVASFCLAPPASFMALHRLSLATVYVSTALAQLAVVLGSIAFFGERYAPRQWIALALIIAGVVTFNIKGIQ